MERVQLVNNQTYPRLIHGLWRLADWNHPFETTLDFIQHCVDQGITTFDHTDIYGSYSCEKLFGDALKLTLHFCLKTF
ncbi:aldo/keto reductase [Rossellomorea sp. BNER]|uniref:aldo/keto reductase n=1 Tax=Rossellomorea sp. BNER TaxID=2962031 RepID=UPI003AF2CB78|nr:aldo/keto reductase [Rossellomorea sp. BNER]